MMGLLYQGGRTTVRVPSERVITPAAASGGRSPIQVTPQIADKGDTRREKNYWVCALRAVPRNEEHGGGDVPSLFTILVRRSI